MSFMGDLGLGWIQNERALRVHNKVDDPYNNLGRVIFSCQTGVREFVNR